MRLTSRNTTVPISLEARLRASAPPRLVTTSAIVAATCLVFVLQLARPETVTWLQRDIESLKAGEWWLAVLGICGATVMSLIRDGHGPGFVTGVMMGALIIGLSRRGLPNPGYTESAGPTLATTTQ